MAAMVAVGDDLGQQQQQQQQQLPSWSGWSAADWSPPELMGVPQPELILRGWTVALFLGGCYWIF
jgi:hypothetical protein